MPACLHGYDFRFPKVAATWNLRNCCAKALVRWMAWQLPTAHVSSLTKTRLVKFYNAGYADAVLMAFREPLCFAKGGF